MQSAVIAFLWWTAIGWQTPSPQIPDAPPPKAILRGHIFALDTGKPLKRAECRLNSATRQDTVARTLSDKQGAFEFQDVERGTYMVRCLKAGYLDTPYGQKAPGQPAVPLAVRPGQELRDLNLHAWRSGAISGQVVDEDGDPVTNAPVQLYTRKYVRGQAQIALAGGQGHGAVTDDRGRYRVKDLEPGWYYVVAQGPLWIRQHLGFTPQFYPNAASYQDAQRVRVTAGEEVRHVNFTFVGTRTLTLSGRVVDQAGAPASRGAVFAAPSGIATTSEAPIRTDGTFQLTGLTPGRYRLYAAGIGTQRPSTRYVGVTGDVTGFLLRTGPGVAVSGKAIVEGGAASLDGKVIHLKSLEPFLGEMPVQTKIRADSTFEFTDVQPGRYSLRMGPIVNQPSASPSLDRYYLREMRVEGRDLWKEGFAVEEGVPFAGIEVVLDMTGGSVEGRVLSEDPQASRSGVQVVMFSADPQRHSDERHFHLQAPDQNGSFTIAAVIPGEYRILVWPYANGDAVLDPDLYPSLEKYATTVLIQEGKRQEVSLKLLPEVKKLADAFLSGSVP
jgi:hypothetical protein